VKYSTQILLLFIIIEILEVSTYSIPIRPPVLSYILIYLCLFLFINFALHSNDFIFLPVISKNLFKLYWLYSIIIIIYGILNSDTYWDYKHIFIVYIPSIIISFTIFLGLRVELILDLFKFIINKLLPTVIFLSFIVWFIDDFREYVHSVVVMGIPIYLFILAFPFLQMKHKYIVIFLSLICIYIDTDYRANVMKIIVCWLCVLFYYLLILKPRIINLITPLILIAPLLFLQAGIAGKLDVFKYLSESEIETRISKANTRSFIYEEVFRSIKDRDTNIFFGGGAAAGHNTDVYFEEKTASLTAIRHQTEVAFLNTIIKSGLIGVIFNLVIIIIPAYFAVNHSNNNFSKMLGFYLIFSWIFYFVEIPLMVNINYFLFYLIIGLCLNTSFREYTDSEIKFFFKSL